MVYEKERCAQGEAADILAKPVVYQWASDDKLSERRAQVCLLILACIWGADYLMPQPRGSLSTVEHVVPLQFLGGLFLIFGIMGIIGELWIEVGKASKPVKVPIICNAENRWWPSFTAHLALCGVYSALGFGYILEMIVDGHLWGGRAPAVMVAFASVHWVFAQKRKHNALP